MKYIDAGYPFFFYQGPACSLGGFFVRKGDVDFNDLIHGQVDETQSNVQGVWTT